MNGGRIVVSYAGVHQAYQLALAAHELNELEAFYCALYDAPGKWGGLVARLVGHDVLMSRRVDGLDAEKAVEYPWPLVWKAVRDRFNRRGRNDLLSAYAAFDRWVAGKLGKSPPCVFVGTAASDLRSLETAKSGGSILVHDCPGLHPLFGAELVREAADRAGLRRQDAYPDLSAWDGRKLSEYALADVLLVYSEIHRKSFESAGYSGERLFESPLWVDTGFWHPKVNQPGNTASARALKLLFVGSIDLRKGVPFLLEAVAKCGNAVRLTVVGARNAYVDTILDQEKHNFAYLPPQRKSQLRHIYASHDVLVLPSVGDPFGFVALEAMACGIPVIVTDNCGVPVPDPSWRVPAMDAEGLARRIMQYADDRTLVLEHGRTALGFAAEFGPERYRRNIQALFRDLLDGRR